jgi:hypothetical protein
MSTVSQLAAKPPRNIPGVPAEVKPEQHVLGKFGRNSVTALADLAEIPLEI